MKEIKFRAFDIEGDGMFYDVHKGIDFEDASKYTFDKFLNPDSTDVHEWVLMQFTGLKDKNGKEIYEGDILYDLDYSMISGSDRMPEKRIVVWYHDHATFKLGYADPDLRNGGDFPSGKYLCEINCRDSFEVIGNVYENPELLKP